MADISDVSIMLFPWGAEEPSVPEIIAAAKLAEELGFHSVTLPTHLTLPPSWLFEDFDNRHVLDALAVVPAVAAATSTIRIGFNSILPPLLPPYAWAKYLATLDVMSEGRLIVGAAMGWWEEDFEAAGVPRRERGKRFDEQLEAITRLWTEDEVTYHGEHYQLDRIGMEPKPVQKPYPPIWIGGGLKSVGRTARYGDYILAFWPSVGEASDVWVPELRKHGAEWGRDPKLASFTFAYVAASDQELSDQMPRLQAAVSFDDADVDPMEVTIAGSPERCAQQLRDLHEAGVAHFVVEFQFHGLESVAFGMAQMERFAGEVAPLL